MKRPLKDLRTPKLLKIEQLVSALNSDNFKIVGVNYLPGPDNKNRVSGGWEEELTQ